MISRRRKHGKDRSTLAHLGLAEKGGVPFQHYSDGMKQRLALARALLKDPKIMLLDEPTRSLDPLSQREIRKLVRGLLVDRLGKTVLLVTHSLAEAEAACDRLAIMHHGHIAAIGTVEEVKARTGRNRLGQRLRKRRRSGRMPIAWKAWAFFKRDLFTDLSYKLSVRVPND